MVKKFWGDWSGFLRSCRKNPKGVLENFQQNRDVDFLDKFVVYLFHCIGKLSEKITDIACHIIFYKQIKKNIQNVSQTIESQCGSANLSNERCKKCWKNANLLRGYRKTELKESSVGQVCKQEKHKVPNKKIRL